jgi:REP element-mobilizing transposase RayT
MRYNPNVHHRRSIRLAGYDYSQPGAYYVTICTATRECIFGEVVNGEMRLNRFGAMAHREWIRLPRHYPKVKLDAFVVMPIHVHAIIWIIEVEARPRPLSEIVGGFKM